MMGEFIVATDRPRDSRHLQAWAALLVLEAFALVGYFALTPERVGELRYLLYPFVWLNVGLWAVVRVRPAGSATGYRLVGLAVGVGYFIALMAVPGKIGIGVVGAPVDVRIGWYAPGWGPLVAVVSPWVRLFLVPFEVGGYAALAYLVYANVITFTRGTLSGALGLVTCVGCTVPVLVPLLGLLGGPAASLATTAYAYSYDLGTVVFVATVGLLVYGHDGRLVRR